MEIFLAGDDSEKVLLVEAVIVPGKSVSDLFTGSHHSGRSVWIGTKREINFM